jgi:hypothetical protein
LKHRRLLKFCAAIAVFIIGSAAAGTLYLSHVNRRSAITTTILWARLAPFPQQARHVRVDVKGSMFTREFVISFDSPPVVIQQWIASSPGPASARRVVTGPITTYAITPGGGAAFAELKVDKGMSHVVIRSFWS